MGYGAPVPSVLTLCYPLIQHVAPAYLEIPSPAGLSSPQQSLGFKRRGELAQTIYGKAAACHRWWRDKVPWTSPTILILDRDEEPERDAGWRKKILAA